jgi:DNA-binding SARP family transcriptional activator
MLSSLVPLLIVVAVLCWVVLPAFILMAAAVGSRVGPSAPVWVRICRARALELLALTDESTGAGPLIEEALSTWRAVDDPIAVARAEALQVLLADGAGGSSGTAGAGGERFDAALAPLRALGARGLVDELLGLRDGARGELAGGAPSGVQHGPSAAPAVAIRSLGGFGVLLDGRPVPPSAWQSRKARDLLKILVTQRGRPVTREYLMELLWPEDDPSRLSNRLSVALATVRGILDPAKRLGAEHCIVTDRQTVRLDLSRVSVDVHHFLDVAADGLARHAAGDPDAPLALEAAEALYTGDFLEDEPYADWPIVLREEARAAYAATARALAERATARADTEGGVKYYLRLLERDPYDEGAHLGLIACLVRARRHGDARRRYQAYTARMDELGVESAPFPGAPAA